MRGYRTGIVRDLVMCACALFMASACGGGDGDGDDNKSMLVPGGSQDMGQMMPATCTPSCAQGAVCVEGVCMAGSTPDMGQTPVGAAVGAACASGPDCGTKLCLNDEDIPGGYCSKICGTGLPGADDRCPSGSVCVQVAEAASACLATCGQDSECRSGYVCEETGSQGSACVPACTSDLDCAYGDVCESSGRCVLDDSGQARIGSACDLDEECAGEFCLDEDTFDWPGGTCTADCTGLGDGDFCDGQSASSGVCVLFDTDGLCLPSCATSTDCRDGYVCSVDEGDVYDHGYGFCLPSCEFSPCAEGDICDITGVCKEDVLVPQRITSRTLGTLDLDNMYVTELTLDVPADALSFTVTLETDNPMGTPIIDRLLGPSGEVLFDAYNPLDSAMKYFGGEDELAAFIYPNAPTLNLPPGQYILEVAATAPAKVKAELHIKEGSDPILESLPLTLWFLDNPYFNAAQAQSDAAFQSALAQMVAIYASAGIILDPIEYREPAEDVAIAYSVFDEEQVSMNFVIEETIGSRPAAGAHMVFNDQILFGGDGGLYGVSAGLPGAPGLNDSRALGVFVCLDTHLVDTGLDDVELGLTMAHELGHYLGLYHISEADGSSHDPLADTAECYGTSDTDGSGDLSGDECGGAAATNMMFWTSSPSFTQDKISPAQEWVLHRNPAMFE